MSASLIVHDPGLFSTIQDAGRWGYLRYGVSNSGAMDKVSLHIANILVGNDPGEAAVEFTASGGVYEAAADSCRIAIVGGNFPVAIDGEPAPPFSSCTLRRGTRIDIGYAISGMRGYLAVAGGFDLTPILGSVSTQVRFGLGGLDGKPLGVGSPIPLRNEEAPPDGDRCLDPALLPSAGGPLRVIMGPQDDYFTEAGKQTFLSAGYRVSDQSDRMGYRLDGPDIEHADDFNIVSDGIAAGSVQVPGNRKPIVLLADRQTTGGYPKIATVISADLHRLAQMGPGETMRFSSVSIAEAEEQYLALAQCLETIARSMEPADAESLKTYRLLSINLIDGIL
jgi:biotin-dependent carboxylase-like uncharacterized protein